MCQRLARMARPISMAPRMIPRSISVRLARTARGSRKSGTPLAIASTPVERAAAGGEGLEDEQDGDRLQPRGRQLRRPLLGLVEPEGMDEADGDDGQETDDEHHRRQQEGARRLAEAPQVEHHDEEEDAQAQRHRGPVQGGKGRLEPGDAGRDGDGDGEGVVDDQRGGGDQAGVGAEVGAGDRVGPAAHRVGVDHLAVGEDQDGQEGDDGDRDGEDQVQGPGARDGQHEDDGLGPVGHRRRARRATAPTGLLSG